MRLEQFMVDEARPVTIKKITDTPEWNALQPWLINPQNTKEFLTAVEQAKKECKPAIQLMKKNRWMVRGTNTPTMSAGKMKPRTNRIPKDTAEGVSLVFDDILNDVFGWRGRSSGLFVVSDAKAASQYGELHIVIPSGKFQYIWSKEQADAITALDESSIMIKFRNDYKKEITATFLEGAEWKLRSDSRFSETAKPDLTDKKKARKFYIDTLMSWDKYLTRDAAEAYVDDQLVLRSVQRGSGNGENWWADQVLAMDAMNNESPFEWANKAMKDTIERIVLNEMGYQDNEIERALRRGHEIMINTPHYYYFHYEYKEVLSLLLGIQP